MRRILSMSILLTVALLCSLDASGEGRRVRGVVKDSISGERLGYVNVRAEETKKGVVTDPEGGFSFYVPGNGLTVTVFSLGYADKSVRIHPNDRQPVEILLAPSETDLQEVVIRPRKEKYSKRNNPAVAFMQRIREAKDKGDPTKEKEYSYDLYSRMTVGLNDFNTDLTAGKNRKKIAFMLDYVDTAAWTGKRVLDLLLKEKHAARIFSRDPAVRKEVVDAERSVGIDEAMNSGNVTAAFADVLREIDIYDGSITLMQNRFVSPLSAVGPDFYKYYLSDTVPVDGVRCVELTFVPRNPQSMGFNGKLYVPLGDTTMFVKRVTMRVPRDINLNYVDNIFISQNFVKDSLGNRHKTLDDLSLELRVMPGTPSFYGRRVTVYDNFSYSIPDSQRGFVSKLGSLFVLDEADSRPPEYWETVRMVPLSYAESRMDNMTTLLRKVPFLYWTEKVVSVLAKGYIRTGRESRFDFGPVNTLVSANSVEGARFRVGGVTTANLSPRWFARGYLAYGTKDRKFKYSAEVEFSFHDKKYHSREFPVHSLRALCNYDLDNLGQRYLFTNADNIFLSLKRKSCNLTTYRRLFELSYNLELLNHFSLTASLRHERREATPWVPFILPNGVSTGHTNTATVKLQLRYAPGETFAQGMTNRVPINLDAPVLTLTHEYGPKGVLGSDYSVNVTELSVFKRFWFSAFGYADTMLRGGIVWSQVQFPSLLWPNANLSYTIQPESYSLMGPMEFANDRYAAFDLTYWMQGLIFNHIPLVNKLKLREVFTFKALMGGLSHKNNPEYNDNLFRFPIDSRTRAMGKTPYMEIGVGIDNILTILRVDYMWRLTYRDTPGVDRHGLRVSLHFSF